MTSVDPMTTEEDMGLRGPQPNTIHLTNAQRRDVDDCIRRGTTEQRVAMRARILRLSHDGVGPSDIASEIGWHRASITKFLARFRRFGLDALLDQPRSGRPRTISPSAESRHRLAGV